MTLESEPVTTMTESTAAADRHGPGAIANSLHLIHKQEAERALTGNDVGFLKTQSPHQVIHLLYEGHSPF